MTVEIDELPELPDGDWWEVKPADDAPFVWKSPRVAWMHLPATGLWSPWVESYWRPELGKPHSGRGELDWDIETRVVHDHTQRRRWWRKRRMVKMLVEYRTRSKVKPVEFRSDALPAAFTRRDVARVASQIFEVEATASERATLFGQYPPKRLGESR